MTLTLPILIFLWVVAFLCASGGSYMFWKTRQKRWVAWGYLGVGFFAVACPLKIALPPVNILGMLFLTVMWPFWIGQSVFGYSMQHWFPEAFWAWLVSF